MIWVWSCLLYSGGYHSVCLCWNSPVCSRHHVDMPFPIIFPITLEAESWRQISNYMCEIIFSRLLMAFLVPRCKRSNCGFLKWHDGAESQARFYPGCSSGFIVTLFAVSPQRLSPWVGLRKINVSYWGWEDMSPFTNSSLRWLPGEPSDSGFCAYLEEPQVTGLRANPCTATAHGLICEKATGETHTQYSLHPFGRTFYTLHRNSLFFFFLSRKPQSEHTSIL